MDFPKRFVCEDPVYSSYLEHVPSPVFRKSFCIEGNVAQAELLISGLGFYDLFLNGRKITKGILAPYLANANHYVYFDRYDLSPYLREGENVMGVMLGDGLLNGKKGRRRDPSEGQNAAPMLALSTQIRCGEKTIAFDSGDFLCKKGPILFNDFRTGVFYDARQLEDGWCSPGFREEGWHKPIQVEAPLGQPIVCQVEPITVYKELKPVAFYPGELAEYARKFEVPLPEGEPIRTGGYIYDFGENNAGIFRLKIKGTPGQRIDMVCAEQLSNGKLNYTNLKFYPDGYAQRDVYYLRGGEEEVFEPQFTYHGYRYIYISGITPEQATEDLLTYLAASSKLESKGDFHCSDPIANAIYDMGRRSDLSNFYYYPSDCPQREKNGWTGDIALSAEHMLMTLSVENSLEEWLRQLRAAQVLDGRLPGIAPTNRKWVYNSLTGPAWDIVLFEVPYQIWRLKGRTQQILDNAAAMLRYLEYVSRRRNEKGLVHYGIGDWMPVGKKPESFDADVGFTDSVMVYRACCLASEMFDAVGLSLHKSFADRLGKEILYAIRREYVKEYTVIPSCQTVQAMALHYGIFQPEEEKQAFAVLLDMLEKENYYFTCGVLGIRILFHVLAKYGRADLAYEMITRKEFPSYGYWAAKGETTMLESFTPYDEYFDDSKNHHFLGDVVGWFMRWCVGIHVLRPDYVEIAPCYVPQLEECSGSMKFPGGTIEVHWTRENGDVSLSVNTTGNVQYKLL